MYVMKSTREALIAQEKTIVTGECCYLNPLIRRIIRFIGESSVFISAKHFSSVLFGSSMDFPVAKTDLLAPWWHNAYLDLFYLLFFSKTMTLIH